MADATTGTDDQEPPLTITLRPQPIDKGASGAPSSGNWKPPPGTIPLAIAPTDTSGGGGQATKQPPGGGNWKPPSNVVPFQLPGAAAPATVAGKQAPAAAEGQLTDKSFYDYLISSGATKNEAVLLTSAAKNESDFDPTRIHDGGIGLGLFGHNGDRLAAMQQQIAAAGGNITDWQAQAKFALQELRSRPEHSLVDGAKSPQDLAIAQMYYERPRGFTSSDPQAGDNFSGRLNATSAYWNGDFSHTGAPQTPDVTPGGQALRSGVSYQDVLRNARGLFAKDDPTIDYSTGAPFATQLALASADNMDEAYAALAKRYPQGNFGVDQQGRWWVVQGDQKVAVRPEKSLTNPLTWATPAELVAGAPETAGAVGGGIIGAGVGGPFGAAAGAGLGGAAAKGLVEGDKALQGTLDKDPTQEVGALANSAALNSAFSMLDPAAKGARNFVDWWTHQTPTTKEMTRRMLAGGAIPPWKTAFPGAKLAHRDQNLRNILAGNPEEHGNIVYMQGRIRDLLEGSDLFRGAEDVDEAMSQIFNRNAALSSGEESTALADRVQRFMGERRAAIAAAKARVNAILDQATADFTNEASAGADANLAQRLADPIVEDRRQFGAAMSQLYRSIDRMAGDEKIVPIGPLVDRAKELLRVIPQGQKTDILQGLAGENKGRMLTFSQAHDLRTMLRDQARRKTTNLTPNWQVHELNENADMVDEAMDELADMGDSFDFPGIANDNGLPAQAVAALKEADALYARGINKFKDGLVNRLVNMTKSGLLPDPNVVAKLLMAPGHMDATKYVISRLPQETKDQVAKADLFNLLTAVSDTDGTINGRKLMNVLADRSDLMKLVYRPDALAAYRSLAAGLAARDGQIDVGAIKDFSPPGLAQALIEATNKQQQIDEFVASNPLGALASGNPQVVDSVMKRITGSGNEAQLEAVRDTLGENSPEWKMVQRYALKHVLSEAIYETPTVEKNVAGAAIDKVLSGWTEKQQDMLFPGGLKNALQGLAKDARFLFPDAGSDMGLSLAASSIALHFPEMSAIKKYAIRRLIGYLMDRPSIIGKLVGLNEKDPTMAAKVRSIILREIANQSQIGPQNNR